MTTTAEAVPVANGAQALTRAAVEQRSAEPRAAAPVAQYFAGFDGAASAPFPAEAAAVLAAPVNPDEVAIRSDGIVFLPGIAYRRILTRAFGAGAWALLPRGPARTMGDLVIYHGALVVLGRFVSEAVGECQTNRGMTYASSLEGARTDCLTRCCKDLGIAAELWDPDWRGSWQDKYAESYMDAGKKKWSLRQKPTNGNVLAGRNVGTAAAPIVHDAPPLDVPVVGDTGEAPTNDQIAALQAQAKALGWKGPKARAWLKKHFGVESATALTRQQTEDAMMLLLAAGKDDMDAEYGSLVDLMVREGRVSV